MKKLLPKEKICEAYTAIVDNAVTFSKTKNEAHVISSGAIKEYTVTWDGNTYTSNDNATYWQGYPGYPVIAVLMLQGRLSYNSDVAGCFGGVNWNGINKKYNNDYALALDSVIRDRGLDAGSIHLEVNEVYEMLKTLDITIKRSKLRTPKG